jgi:hypothetical protein
MDIYIYYITLVGLYLVIELQNGKAFLALFCYK